MTGDARPAISIDPNTNKILYSNNAYKQTKNRFQISDWWLWGVGNPEGVGEDSAYSSGEVTLGDDDFVIESNKIYTFNLQWQPHYYWPSKTEVVLSIEEWGVYDSDSPTERPTTEPFDYTARIDFSYGDYFCENYMDMLAVFGEYGENSALNVSDFQVNGLCPFLEEPEERKMCCH